MGDITQALRTAQSGLLGNQEALHTVSNNVANINTKGYSRKIIRFEQVTVAGVGAGTRVAEIQRSVDEGLLKTLRIENGEKNTFAVQKDFYGRLQDLFGKPGENSSFSHLAEKLGEAFELLAVNPDKTLESAEVVRRANNLLGKIKGMSETIQDLRLQADRDLAELVGDANVMINKIDQLNDDIIANSVIGQDVTDLKDQRDLELDKLSEVIDIRYFYRNDGDVVVFTEGGRTIVDTTPPKITHVAISSSNPELTHSEGHINGIFVGPAVAGNDITNEIREGEMKGLIDLRDTVLPGLQAELDEFASELRDAINQVHNRGTAFPGLQNMNGTRAFIRPTEQTMTLDADDDVTIVLSDASGNQSAATTLKSIMTSNLYGTGGSQVQSENGPWAISEVATQVEDWLQANGAADATARIGPDGKLSVVLNAATLNLSFRDETATADGSAAEDAVIRFDADGDGVTDETVNGFSYFFGLNDFFVDPRLDNIWESEVVSPAFTSPGSPATETLTFRDTASGTIGALTVDAGTSLADLATMITNNIPNVTASVVPEGNGVRLRISQNGGSAITVTQGSGAAGGALLTELRLKDSDTGISLVLQVRDDIQAQTAKVATGQLQWDADKGADGEYFLSVGDDTIAQALSEAMTANRAFDQSGGLAARNTTFAGYAAEVLSNNASLASFNDRQLDSQKSLVESLQFKSDSVRGVNLDEEMADLLVYEQAYAAAARVISVIQSMIAALERAIQ